MNCLRIAVLVALGAIVVTAGCVGLTPAEGETIEIGTTEDRQGGTHVYVQATDGQLPTGTEIAVESTLAGVEDASGTLERPADRGTRVFLGGPLGTDSLTTFRFGMVPQSTVVPEGLSEPVTVTITVDTGEHTATESFTIG